MNDFVGYIDSTGAVFDGTFDYEGRVGPIGPQGPQGYTPIRGVDYWTTEDQAYIVAEATSLINGKIEEYNNNAAAKTEAFNDNASSKTTAFNNNASSMTTAFNNNALSKVSDFNSNASGKTSTFDSHVTSKTTEFDSHVDSEFNELTGNFYTKSQTYSKDEVDGKLASTYHYKGSVTDYTELPSSGQQVGDVYNIETAGGGYNAGDNVAWTGEDWDILAGTVDLSNYYTKTQVDDIAGAKQNTIDNSHKLSSDLVDDTSHDNKFIKTISGNISVKDLESGVYYISSGTLMYRSNGGILLSKPTILVTTKDTNAVYYYHIMRASHSSQLIGGLAVGFANSDGTGGYTLIDPLDLQTKSNLVTSVTTSTTKYPSAKAVYDELALRDTKIAALEAENEQLLDQIPTATATGETIQLTDSSNLPLKDFTMLGNATQDGTPTPDAPQDVYVVTGDNTVKVLGKNLVDFSTPVARLGTTTTYTFTNDILDISCTENTYSGEQYDITDLFKIYAGQKVRLAFKSITNRTGDGVIGQFNVYHNDGSSTSYLQAVYASGTPASYVTIPSNSANIDYVRLVIYANNTNTSGAYRITMEKPMLVIYGNDTTNYEPYTEQTQLISLGSIELAKIGDYRDRIYKSGDKWWLEKNVYKMILNGTNVIPRKGTTTANDRFVFDVWNVSMPRCLVNTASLCNRFVYSSDNQVPSWKNNDETQMIVNFSAYGETTLEQFKSWLANNPLTLYQPLKTPTTTEITDTTLKGQLENILKLNTYRNISNISVTTENEQPTLTIEYRQDLGTLVDKITNLEARVSLLE